MAKVSLRAEEMHYVNNCPVLMLPLFAGAGTWSFTKAVVCIDANGVLLPHTCTLGG